MALSLECICNPDASICQITGFIWNVQIIRTSLGIVPDQWLLSLAGGTVGPYYLLNPASGIYAITLPLSDTKTSWGDLTVTLQLDSSTRILPPANEYEEFIAIYNIEQDYHCVNLVNGKVTNDKIYAYPAIIGPLVRCYDPGTTLRGSVVGGISGVFYLSTPLGACLSGAISTSDSLFTPPPKENTINIDESGHICLCATGGSGDYTFSIVSGNLPSGQTLNSSTGCIEGTPDGVTPGSPSITYQVTDTGGADTSTTTGGDIIGGTLRAFGATVTRISGGSWTPDMVGQTILINGAPYTVAAVADGDNLTLSSTVGIIDPATWSYTSPVVPPPTPGPPDTAQVTCGYTVSCPPVTSGFSPGGGNFAF